MSILSQGTSCPLQQLDAPCAGSRSRDLHLRAGGDARVLWLRGVPHKPISRATEASFITKSQSWRTMFPSAARRSVGSFSMQGPPFVRWWRRARAPALWSAACAHGLRDTGVLRSHCQSSVVTHHVLSAVFPGADECPGDERQRSVTAAQEALPLQLRKGCAGVARPPVDQRES